jgi:CHAT domain-containing protein
MLLQKAHGLDRPRVHWCPTGVFTFAPLHAAGIYIGNQQECCSDYMVSSYTPTLTALLRAQANAAAISKKELRIALLAVEQAQDHTLPPLYGVEEEISDISAVASQADVLLSHNFTFCLATTDQVSESLFYANMIHFACHGIQNTADALKSGFCLSDGQFTVSQLMELDLKDAFFTFLSACETAKGDKTQPDQTVHLAAAMLFAGFRSVFATMWSVKNSCD